MKTSAGYSLKLSYDDKNRVDIGNPLTWGNRTYTWTAGRRLSSVTMPGKTISYTYGADGCRTSKTVNGVTTTYHLDGGRISALKRGSDELLFVYDENGDVTGFYWNGEPYAYAKNLQGDVIGIIDENGAWAVQYEYDAWGKQMSATGNLASTLGVLNPFRYRSYNYDEETGLYYLNSRYYEPEVGRFLNGDGALAGVGGDVQGYNLFAYCFDNPVMYSDSSGNWPKWATGALCIVGGAIQIATGIGLGATVGWTGVGAVVASFLVVNGSATVTQGIGQIVNDVSNSNIMSEDNVIRTSVQAIGEAIGGDKGAEIAVSTYDVAVIAANIYAGGVTSKNALQQAGKLPVKVPINKVVNNPADEFVISGPAQGVIGKYCRSIPYNGYGKIYAKPMAGGYYQLTNGHHRVAALRRLGIENIKIYITK